MNTYSKKKLIMDAEAMSRTLKRIAYEIAERHKGTEDLCIIGIRRRGVTLGKRIRHAIERNEGVLVPFGELDITSYRDDIEIAQDYKDETRIDFNITGRKIILVDDVLYTGRTVRAALDALAHRGRPAMVQLAVLVDRGHRELPFKADYVGKSLPTAKSEIVQVETVETDGCDRVVIAQE